MSRLWIALPCLLLLATGGFFLERTLYPAPVPRSGKLAEPVEETVDQQPTYELSFPTTHHDFGRIDTVSKHVFTFENHTSQAVRILDTKSSCTCTVAKPEPDLLQPGQTGRVAMEIDPSRFPRGRHQKSIELEYKGAELRHTRLTFQFENRPDVVIPDRVELSGFAGKSITSTFEILDYRDKPFVIKAIRTSSPDVQVVILDRPTAYLPGWQHRFEVTYRSDKAPGTHRETILLDTDDPARPIISVPFSARSSPRLRVAPETVRLRRVEGSSDAVGKIFATDAEGEVLKLDSIVPSHPNLKALIVSKGESRCEIEVRWTPTVGVPKAPLSLQLEFSKPRKESVCVPVAP